jgi:hypothetical protein
VHQQEAAIRYGTDTMPYLQAQKVRLTAEREEAEATLEVRRLRGR